MSLCPGGVVQRCLHNILMQVFRRILPIQNEDDVTDSSSADWSDLADTCANLHTLALCLWPAELCRRQIRVHRLPRRLAVSGARPGLHSWRRLFHLLSVASHLYCRLLRAGRLQGEPTKHFCYLLLLLSYNSSETSE